MNNFDEQSMVGPIVRRPILHFSTSPIELNCGQVAEDAETDYVLSLTADASGHCEPKKSDLTISLQNWRAKLTAQFVLCNDRTSIDKGTPAERRGRKATGLRGNLRQRGCQYDLPGA